MSHPKHPRCDCGKSLYKAFQKGKPVKKTDPWAFCRNASCALSGPEGIVDVSKAGRARAVPPSGELPPPEVQMDLDAEQEREAERQERRVWRKKRFKKRLKAFLTSRKVGDSWEETTAYVERVTQAFDDVGPLQKVKTFETPAAVVTEYDGKKRRKARPAPEDRQEPKAVRDAREGLRPLVALMAPAGTDKTAVGLILAILNQELGNKSGANQLIDELKLDKLFGIEKF